MLFEQIERNKRNTVWIVLLFIAITLFAGGVVSLYFIAGFMPGVVLMAVFLVFYIPLNLISARKAVLKIAHGIKVKGEMLNEPKVRQLVNVVEELSIGAGIPMPEVYIVPSNSLNAFATGMSPEKAAVAITVGLLETLDREELEGVMAHEIAHIQNYDIRLTTVALGLSAVLLFLSDLALNGISIFWTAPEDREYKGVDTGGMRFILILILMALPQITLLLERKLSRNREYLADATAVDITRNPVGLKRALVKLALQPEPRDNVINPTLNQMCITSPKLNFNMLTRGTQLDGVDPRSISEQEIFYLLSQEPKDATSTHPRIYDRLVQINQM